MTYALVLAALADTTRRHIFEALLDSPKSVGELAKKQPVSRPAVSQHLKVLEEANLVSVKPQGTRRLYAIKREGLETLKDYLDHFWSDALTAYNAEISRRINQNREQSKHA